MTPSWRSVLLGVLVVISRIGYYIVTPLWIDFHHASCSSSHSGSDPFTLVSSDGATLNNSTKPLLILYNSSDPNPLRNQTGADQIQIHPYFALLSGQLVAVALYGVALALVRICRPLTVPAVGWRRVHVPLMVAGLAQAVSMVLFYYSLSGTKVPLYLTGLLANCYIPMQFIVQTLILRRRLCVKLVCGLAVVIGVFLSLLTIMFPQTLPAGTKESSCMLVGHTIPWVICFVLSLIPSMVVNAMMKRSLRDVLDDFNMFNISSLFPFPMARHLFFLNLYALIAAALLFWVDLIPGFGTSADITEFGESMQFNFRCFVGGSGCAPVVPLLGWFHTALHFLGCLAFLYMLTDDDGSKLTTIISCSRTVVVFVFWKLFGESPFGWHPIGDLSTWLAVLGIVIVLPAIIVYEKVSATSEIGDIGQEPPVLGDREWLIHSIESHPINYRSVEIL